MDTARKCTSNRGTTLPAVTSSGAPYGNTTHPEKREGTKV